MIEEEGVDFNNATKGKVLEDSLAEGDEMEDSRKTLPSALGGWG